MKKFFAFALLLVLLVSSIPMADATNIQVNKSSDEIKFSAKTEFKNGIQHFRPFDYNGYNLNLFPESTLTKQEAVGKFSKAYAFISKDLSDKGIDINLDSEQFQDAVKSYFLIELADKALQKEIIEFATFMDFYENKVLNDKIIKEAQDKKISILEMKMILPIKGNFTKNDPQITKSEVSTITTSTYSGSTAATYATTWWNKTNNSNYPYYATYNNQSTSTNDLNDLPAGSAGQSNPKRAWNDCTNFVSQAIYAGGIPTIKSGLLFPHTSVSNWYYDNSKPSHTWGGAPNFYQHFSARVGVATSSADLQVGDAVSVDFTGDGSVDHTILITKITATTNITPDKQLVTYHTYDTNQTKTLKYFYDYNANVKIYGYEMDKI